MQETDTAAANNVSDLSGFFFVFVVVKSFDIATQIEAVNV